MTILQTNNLSQHHATHAQQTPHRNPAGIDGGPGGLRRWDGQEQHARTGSGTRPCACPAPAPVPSAPIGVNFVLPSNNVLEASASDGLGGERG